MSRCRALTPCGSTNSSQGVRPLQEILREEREGNNTRSRRQALFQVSDFLLQGPHPDGQILMFPPAHDDLVEPVQALVILVKASPQLLSHCVEAAALIGQVGVDIVQTFVGKPQDSL
jgi:hypothetical protein